MKIFRPVRTIAGLRDGVTVVLGETDVARMKSKTQATRDASLQPRGGGRPLSGGQPEVAPVPVDDGPEHVGLCGKGDDVWRGQNDGSEEIEDILKVGSIYRCESTNL